MKHTFWCGFIAGILTMGFCFGTRFISSQFLLNVVLNIAFLVVVFALYYFAHKELA